MDVNFRFSRHEFEFNWSTGEAKRHVVVKTFSKSITTIGEDNFVRLKEMFLFILVWLPMMQLEVSAVSKRSKKN